MGPRLLVLIKIQSDAGKHSLCNVHDMMISMLCSGELNRLNGKSSLRSCRQRYQSMCQCPRSQIKAKIQNKQAECSRTGGNEVHVNFELCN